jgi:myo-inositol-1-phosphate synthase
MEDLVLESRKVRVAIAGVGNCALSLLQGISYYRAQGTHGNQVGLMHYNIGGFTPGDIEVVCAFDIDARKVGKPLGEAAKAKPNCTTMFFDDLEFCQAEVFMGPVLDGYSPLMDAYPEDERFLVADLEPVDAGKVLQEKGAEILISYLPVGADQATRYYADQCLKTGVSLINCIPSFIASDPEWYNRFDQAGIPIIGDDVKSQVGATIVHRVLSTLFRERGAKIRRTYQLNVGGNTDFMNMLDRTRLKSKKISKTEAVVSTIEGKIESRNVHIGPSDYVPWQKDNKVCFLRIEAEGFLGAPIELELRLSVEDSPNSGGVVVDAIRFLKLAREKGLSGPLYPACAYFMKHPPVEMDEKEARVGLEAFLQGSIKEKGCQ